MSTIAQNRVLFSDAQASTMIERAKDLGVLADVLCIIAMIRQGGIIEHQSCQWTELFSNESRSTTIAMLQAFRRVEVELGINLKHNPQAVVDWDSKPSAKEFARQFGILRSNFSRAAQEYQKMVEELSTIGVEVSTDYDRDAIEACVIAGLADQVHVVRNRRGRVENAEGQCGNIAYVGVVPRDARYYERDTSDEFLLGVPFLLQNGSYLLTMSQVVSTQQYEKVTGRTFSRCQSEFPRYDSTKDRVLCKVRLYSGGLTLGYREEPLPKKMDSALYFAAHLAAQSISSLRSTLAVPESQEEAREILLHNRHQWQEQQRVQSELGCQRMSLEERRQVLAAHFFEQLCGATCFGELASLEQLQLPCLSPSFLAEQVVVSGRRFEVGELDFDRESFARELTAAQEALQQRQLLVNLPEERGETRYWVISENGLLREPDDFRIVTESRPYRGERVFSLVRRNDLVLAYARQRREPSILKQPTAGPNEAQLERIRQLEHDVPELSEGDFGFDPKKNRENSETLRAIHEHLKRMLPGEELELDDDPQVISRMRNGYGIVVLRGKFSLITGLAGSVPTHWAPCGENARIKPISSKSARVGEKNELRLYAMQDGGTICLTAALC